MTPDAQDIDTTTVQVPGSVDDVQISRGSGHRHPIMRSQTVAKWSPPNRDKPVDGLVTKSRLLLGAARVRTPRSDTVLVSFVVMVVLVRCGVGGRIELGHVRGRVSVDELCLNRRRQLIFLPYRSASRRNSTPGVALSRVRRFPQTANGQILTQRPWVRDTNFTPGNR